jgi:hypothetical protein
MRATLLDRPGRLWDEPPSRAGPAPERSPSVRPCGGRMTLEERLQSAWRGLQAGGAAECPLCGGRMTLAVGGGECGGCGGRLS